MRRTASAFLALAVAGVAAAAVLDAVVAEEPPRPTQAQRLRLAEAGGELVWTDARCRRHSLLLPSLVRRRLEGTGCRLGTEDGGLEVAGGEIVSATGTSVVLGRSAVAREVGDGFRPVDAAGLGGLRYVAVFEGPRTVIVLFEGDSAFLLTHSPGWTDVRVGASPAGSYFSLRPAEGRLEVRDRTGRRLGFPPAEAVAWSPDERYAAVALGDAVSVLPAGGGDEIARLPIAAMDLDWRPAP